MDQQTLKNLPADWEPSLRLYLWDHRTEILNTTVYGNSDGEAAESTEAIGAGSETFDAFHVELRKFSSGQSNPTFLLLISLPGPRGTPSAQSNALPQTKRIPEPRRFVLRKKPASVKVSSAHAIEREFRVLQSLRGSNVPVPRGLLLCEDDTILGTPFYIMEYVDGRIFFDPTLPGMSRRDRAAAYTSAVEVLANIHSLDFRAVGLGNFGRSSGGYFNRQIQTLARVANKQVIRAKLALRGKPLGCVPSTSPRGTIHLFILSGKDGFSLEVTAYGKDCLVCLLDVFATARVKFRGTVSTKLISIHFLSFLIC